MIAGLLLGYWLDPPPAHSQVLDPMYAVPSYTTADPIGLDAHGNATLGLATPDGRFQIAPLQGCEWLAEGQPVLVYPNYTMPPWLKVSTPSGDSDCMVQVDGRMSATPCFVDDAGVCDVSQESNV